MRWKKGRECEDTIATEAEWRAILDESVPLVVRMGWTCLDRFSRRIIESSLFCVMRSLFRLALGRRQDADFMKGQSEARSCFGSPAPAILNLWPVARFLEASPRL